MYCSVCGAEMPESFKFCSQCGASVSGVTRPMLSSPLRRSRDNKKIAGVCGGLARHLGIDPTLIRLVMVCAAIWGFGIVLYVACWIIMPADPWISMTPVMRSAPPRPVRM